MSVKVTKGNKEEILQGDDLVIAAPGAMRPLYSAMFAPGILYNSIKSGMAVDYPVVLDSTRVTRQYFSGSGEWGCSGSTSFNGSAGRQAVGPYRWDAMYAQRSSWGVSNTRPGTDNWALTNDLCILPSDSDSVDGYRGGPWFDRRIPFEAILRPERYIRGINFVDMEPHPDVTMRSDPSQRTYPVSQPLTAALNGIGDEIYNLMAKNFFGEMGNFFLRDNTYTTLRSSIVPNDLRFESGSIYGARFKTFRSTTARIYREDSGSAGNHDGFGDYGAQAVKDGAYVEGGFFPIPQDPQRGCHETFTMYSRPSAFGPPIAGRPDFRIMSGCVDIHGTPEVGASYLNPISMSFSGTLDCFNGYNWAYTPPYYHGEAWCDLIFKPDPSKSYDLEQILAETKAVYTRVDPGPLSGINTGAKLSSGGAPVVGMSPTLIVGSPDVWSHTASYNPNGSAKESTRPPGTGHRPPYAGDNVNANAMQVSASFNLFGIERVTRETIDPKTKRIEPVTSDEIGKRWIIKPKFETPMFNFNDSGVRPISSGSETLTLPMFASASTPRGIWHQFGIIEPDASKGIFMEIGDIPEQWLKYHYNVISSGSVYNDNSPETIGVNLSEKMLSLTDIVGFERETPKARLGQLTDSQKLREAIVIVPYTIDRSEVGDSVLESMSDLVKSGRKKFFSIPREIIDAARSDLTVGVGDDSLDVAGKSIRSLVEKMPRYVLPPWLDFLNIDYIDPIVMYMIEFEYELDMDDLAYIAQNTAPRDSRKITLESKSTAHEILNTELMGIGDILNDDELRWMIFKVKQRSQSDYYEHVVPQVGEGGSKSLKVGTKKLPEYKMEFNWPYDYVSFVEMIKVDAQILYNQREEK